MNQQNSSRLVKIITLLVCTSGVAWFSFSLLSKYQQIQQFKQADNLLSKEEYDLAITAYDRLLAANVDRGHLIWINRGYAFLGLNQYQQMLQSCSTATLIEPDAALAWNCQGKALYYLGQHQKALEAFKQAITRNSKEATFWLNKARVLSELQEYKKAIADSEQAIKLIKQSNVKDKSMSNSLAIALNQKGQNLLKIEQYRKSLAAFEQSLKNSPDYLSAQQGKGIALYELGKYDQAISIFAEILQRKNLTKEQKAMSLLY
ncbi:MAG: tetratricopeptide repeat protein [Pleurocapsa sp.]